MAQFPVAPGYNQLPYGNYIPEIFSMKLLQRYYEEYLTSKIVNFDYEGEVKSMGDKVNIRRVAEASTGRYYIGMSLAVQQIIDEETELLIDHGVFWNVQIDDVQKFQADVNYQASIQENAAIQQKRYVDTQVLGNVYADAHADNIRPNATVNANNVAGMMEAMAIDLAEKFAPAGMHWFVMPYSMRAVFTLNPLFNSADKMGDSQSMIRSGKIGTISGFDLFQSPNLTTSGGYIQTIFGAKTAITFANQFTETQGPLQMESTFAKLLRGLMVFGWKTVQPTHLGKAGLVVA